ncbi:MAG: alpha/beta fold hydrolase [Roseinatronobacter sp.]
MSAMEHITVGDGCRLAYRFDGNSSYPTLILSNSIATDHRMWDGQIAELTKSFHVLRYDTRGHGCSDAPTGAYSLDRLGRDVIELMDALEIETAQFCGLSLGGFVGQWLGLRAPDRIDRLILSNTSPYLGPAPQWDELIAKLLRDKDMTAMADMFIGNWFPSHMIRDEPDTIKAFRHMILTTSPEGLAGCFAVVRDADLRRTNTLIEVPALVIGGTDDTVTLTSHSEEIAEAIPRSHLVLLPGVHMLNVERHDAFLEAVLGWLVSPPT